MGAGWLATAFSVDNILDLKLSLPMKRKHSEEKRFALSLPFGLTAFKFGLQPRPDHQEWEYREQEFIDALPSFSSPTPEECSKSNVSNQLTCIFVSFSRIPNDPYILSFFRMKISVSMAVLPFQRRSLTRPLCLLCHDKQLVHQFSQWSKNNRNF
jgi:hypothetical protein